MQKLTFDARFSTRAMMEFLKAVPAVVGRFVVWENRQRKKFVASNNC